MKDIKTPWYAGYDCGLTEPDEYNSHYHWFLTPERKSDWEKGLKQGKIDKKKALKSAKSLSENVG